MKHSVHYYNEDVKARITALPSTLKARYISLSLRMVSHGPNLGAPHTKALGNSLFELRLKGIEGIARVFYCAQVGRRIIMLHSFVKKTDKIPLKERRVAERRLKEVKDANA